MHFKYIIPTKYPKKESYPKTKKLKGFQVCSSGISKTYIAKQSQIYRKNLNQILFIFNSNENSYLVTHLIDFWYFEPSTMVSIHQAAYIDHFFLN